MSKLPEIQHLTDLENESIRTQLLEWAKDHPMEDHIFHLTPPDEIFQDWNQIQQTESTLVDSVIAGSSAIYLILLKLEEMSSLSSSSSTISLSSSSTISNSSMSMGLKANKFTPSDVDIFMMGRSETQQLTLGITNLFQTQQKSISELLLTFDLPISRAAYNMDCEIWVSAQCLYAILVGKQYVPSYMHDEFSGFIKFIETHSEETIGSEIREKYQKLHQDYVNRLKKYEDRGCGSWIIDTQQIPPWVEHKFSSTKLVETKDDKLIDISGLREEVNQLQGAITKIQKALENI